MISKDLCLYIFRIFEQLFCDKIFMTNTKMQRPIKIFHILDSLGIGGLENGVVNLINHMDKDNFHHTICCIRGKGAMEDRITNKQVDIICLNIKKKDRFAFLKLAHIISKNSPDIVHTRNFGTIDGILAAILARVDIVVHGEHGREFTDPEGLNKKQNFIRRLFFLKTAFIVAVSMDIHNWLIEKIRVPDEKIHTIINGVDTDKFIPPLDKNAAKIKMEIDPSEIVVGSVGRMDKVKNYEMLLSAVSMIKTNARFCIVLVGDGPERKSLESFTAEKGLTNIRFTGKQDNVVNYLQAFDLFVLPSIAEGISNTILEAMACGLHVIATDVGGNRELIENNKTGSLIKSYDVDALADRISWSLANPLESNQIGRAGQEQCKSCFSLDRMVIEYGNLYRKSLGI